jgi:hypothetical protein
MVQARFKSEREKYIQSVEHGLAGTFGTSNNYRIDGYRQISVDEYREISVDGWMDGWMNGSMDTDI